MYVCAFGAFQNIPKYPESTDGNPLSLPLPISVFSWVGIGALPSSVQRVQEAFQSPAVLGVGVGGLVKPPAGQEGGLNSTSHPLGLGTSLDSKESTKEKKKSTGSHNHPGGSRPLWDIIEFNNLFISNLCDKLLTPTE